MAVKPILFNGEMVRAILDGWKTVTRRVINRMSICRYCEKRIMQNSRGKWFTFD